MEKDLGATMINRYVTSSGVIWYSNPKDNGFLVFDLDKDGFADVFYQFNGSGETFVPVILIQPETAQLSRGHIYFTIEFYGDLRKLPLQYAEFPVELLYHVLKAHGSTGSSKLLNILEKL